MGVLRGLKHLKLPNSEKGGGKSLQPSTGADHLGLLEKEGFQFFSGFWRRTFPLGMRSRAVHIDDDALSKLTRLSDSKGSGIVDTTTVLFIDTETTGLGHAANTYAFLVGLIYFEEHSWKSEQLLILKPSQERAMLGYLGTLVEDKKFLCSYNGRSYDWPLLKNRFVYHRLEPVELNFHLDVYHLARAVYRYRLQRTRLTDLEKYLFEMHRCDDVGGEQIPHIYFESLKTGRVGRLLEVVKHNEMDIESTFSVLGVLVDGFSSESGFRCIKEELGFLEWLYRRDANLHELLSRVRKAQHRADLPEVRARLGWLLYQIRRDLGEVDAFTSLLLVVGSATGRLKDLMCHRLAIDFEHRAKKAESALTYAKMISDVEDESARARRLERLERKMRRLVEVSRI